MTQSDLGRIHRKRLLLVLPLPPPWAGVEQVGKMLVESNLKENFDLRVLKSNIRKTNVSKGHLNISGIVKVTVVFWKLFFELLIKKPDVVYFPISQNTSGLLRDAAFIGVAVLFNVPILGHLHGADLVSYLDLLPKWKRRFFLVFLRKIKIWIVLAKSIKDKMSKYFQDNIVEVVYNACPPGINGMAKKNHGKKIVISFMGHLSQSKGFYELIDVAEDMLAENERIEFQFAGERVDDEKNIPGVSSSRSSKQNWLKFEKLRASYPERIRHVGVVVGDEKEIFFHQSDLFVFLSHSESFGLVVVEAMSAGLPIVTTKVGALPEILKEGVNCVFVPIGKSRDIKEKIKNLINDGSLREIMRKENVDFVKKHSVDRMESEITEIINANY